MGLWNKISDFVFSNASESSDTNEFPVITVGDNVSIQVQPSQVFEDASLSPLTPLQLHDLVADGAMTAGYSSFKGYNVFINGVQTAVTSKEDYFKKVDSIRGYEIAQAIINNQKNDIIHKNWNQLDPYFKVRIEGYPQYEKNVNDFLKRLRLPSLLKDNLDDILFNGEKFFKIDWSNSELDDGIDQDSLLSVETRSDVKTRMVYNKSKSQLESATDYLVFRVSSSYRKIELTDGSGSFYKARIPKGVFSESNIDNLATLKMLEALIPINEFMSIDQKLFFNMKVPAGTDPKVAFEQAKKYEKILHTMLSSSSFKSATDFVDKLSRPKVIPIFGDQNEITEKMIPKPDKIDLTRINDLRMTVVSTSNALPKFIGLSDPGNIASYLNFIKDFRASMADSIKDLALSYIDVQEKTFIDPNVITVEVPSVPGVDELDSMDYAQLYSQTLSDTSRLIADASDAIDKMVDNGNVDIKSYVDFINSKLKPLTGRDIFDLKSIMDKAKAPVTPDQTP